MKYLKRIINVMCLTLKLLLKLFAIIGFVSLIVIHVIIYFITIFPILLLQVMEYITICPIYYVITGKKYHEKYNKISEVFFDTLELRKPTFNKAKINRSYRDEFYDSLWQKIKKIDLKLKYE